MRVQRRQGGGEDCDWRRFAFSSFSDPRDGDLRGQVPDPQPPALPRVGAEGRLRVAGAVEGAQGLGLDGGVAGDEGGVGREGVGGDGPDGDDDLRETECGECGWVGGWVRGWGGERGRGEAGRWEVEVEVEVERRPSRLRLSRLVSSNSVIESFPLFALPSPRIVTDHAHLRGREDGLSGLEEPGRRLLLRRRRMEGAHGASFCSRRSTSIEEEKN